MGSFSGMPDVWDCDTGSASLAGGHLSSACCMWQTSPALSPIRACRSELWEPFQLKAFGTRGWYLHSN